MKEQIKLDSSVLEYILKMRREEMVNCETISLAFQFQKELEKWNAEKEEKENGNSSKEKLGKK